MLAVLPHVDGMHSGHSFVALQELLSAVRNDQWSEPREADRLLQ
jgi:hypothetical protein